MIGEPRILLVGAGQVSWHLGHRFAQLGMPPAQVYSRTLSKARELAQSIGSQVAESTSSIITRPDWVLLAVNDDAIIDVAETLSGLFAQPPLVTHCSGATPSVVLKPYFERYGTFYPLQTFSREAEIDFATIPICVEAGHADDLEFLRVKAAVMGNMVYELDDERRKALHVAAVMVNNFTNALYEEAFRLLAAQDLPFDLLRPLIAETARKVQHRRPKDVQTGPAVRGDHATLERHMDFLIGRPELQALYQTLTRLIERQK